MFLLKKNQEKEEIYTNNLILNAQNSLITNELDFFFFKKQNGALLVKEIQTLKTDYFLKSQVNFAGKNHTFF